MKTLRKVLKWVVISLLVHIALFIINILQAGKRSPDGRTIGDILGVDPENATWEDVEKLSRADTMQLFYAANAPDFSSMKGEYAARVLSGGVLGNPTALFTHHVFPTGKLDLKTHWEGKAFLPPQDGESWGYNIFSRKHAGGAVEVFRTRKMRTYIGPTRLGKDGKNSLHLDYSPFNRGIVHTMHDEVRQVNERLFICAGYMTPFGGPLNPGPFVLMGPPTEWVGPDEDE